jgi:hypothetical protein
MTPTMNVRHRLIICFLVVLTAATIATAQPARRGHCSGHYFYGGTEYPYATDIAISGSFPILNNTWQTIASGCTDNRTDNTGLVLAPGVNYHATVTTNAQVRGYMNVGSGEVGVRYEVRFVRKGNNGAADTLLAWYVRQIKREQLNNANPAYHAVTGLNQGELFFATALNVPAGHHRIVMEGRVIDSGKTVTIAGPLWMALQGVPASRFPAASSTNAASFAFTGWTSAVANTLAFTPNETVDVIAHAYFEINGGTPGDTITVGFQLDGEVPSRRNSDFVVPEAVTGYATRQGINITDFIENVSAAPHTLKLWATSRSGRPVTVSSRHIEFVSFPTRNHIAGTSLTFYPDAQKGHVHPATQTVNSVTPAPVQPYAPYLQGGGYWYPVTPEFTMPPDPSGTCCFNWTGAGYIETLGRAGTWLSSGVEMAVEASIVNPATGQRAVVDFMWVPVHVAKDRGHIYFWLDSFQWGNRWGQTLRVWMRRPGANSADNGSFTVGKVYVAAKLVPAPGGYYYDGVIP